MLERRRKKRSQQPTRDLEHEFRRLCGRVPELAPDLAAELAQVQPSTGMDGEYRPCALDLVGGRRIDAAYVVEARTYFRWWQVAPWRDPSKRFVALEDVRAIADSPRRLPPAIAGRIYEGGQSGLGYVVFGLVLADGRTLSCHTGSAVDFVDLPEGVRPADVVDVVLQDPKGRTHPDCTGLAYRWVLYRDDTTRPDDPLFPWH